MQFLSPAAIIVSAVIAMIVGWRAMITQRRVARNRATLDVLFRLEGDPSFLKAASAFKDVRDSRGLLCLLNNEEKKSNRDKDEEFYVDAYLNHLELICVGISQDTIDELFIFQYMYGTFIHDWHSAKDYALKAREQSGNPRVFQKLQLFAESWEGPNRKFVTRKDNPQTYINNNTQSKHPQD